MPVGLVAVAVECKRQLVVGVATCVVVGVDVLTEHKSVDDFPDSSGGAVAIYTAHLHVCPIRLMILPSRLEIALHRFRIPYFLTVDRLILLLALSLHVFEEIERFGCVGMRFVKNRLIAALVALAAVTVLIVTYMIKLSRIQTVIILG